MDMKQITKITLAWELYEQGMPKMHIAKQLETHRETVHLWIRGITQHPQGLLGYLDSYSKAKKGERPRRQVDAVLKRWIWQIREREMDCCGDKIQYFLKKEHAVSVSIPKIYEILKEKYVLRSKWQKNQKRGAVPKAAKAREVIQMDTVDFGELFAFTAVDIFSKEADVVLRPSLTSSDGVVFLDKCMQRRFNGHSETIQADGGPEFKDKFKEKVYAYTETFRISRPYKKNEQSFIESFNRTVRKECLGWNTYKASEIDDATKLIETFLERYHYHRPHMSLGMRPPLFR